MNTRTQYRAECSCCGREQAVDGAGRIADHGYTLDYGWRNGRCAGSKIRHFGTVDGRDYRAKIAASLLDSAARTEKQAAAAQRGEVVLQRLNKRTKLMEDLTGRDLESEIRMMRSHAEQMRRESARMSDSVERWAEKAPRPVEVEAAKAPMIHFYRERWGKFCAGSAMGAQKGHTSSNWEHVNCPKCKERKAYFEAQKRPIG